MSAQPLHPARTSKDNGGFHARRAVIRWAWRKFRRQWRQQVLVLALLTLAITAAIFGSTAVYNIAPVPGNAEFGSANHFIKFEVSDPQLLEATIAQAREMFGSIDVIRHRSVPVLIPGLIDTLDLRTQDPQGPYSVPMLALREGRYPHLAEEVAITDGAAKLLGLRLGNPFTLEGSVLTVVGVVENPSDLNDEFALMAPAYNSPPDEVIILFNASEDEVNSLQGISGMEIGSRPRNEGLLAAVTVLGIATVALLLISLVAATSFMVLAQRRLHQLGMLAAIGANEKHLRLVIVANGAVIGVIAAGMGAVIAVAGWIVIVPIVEPAFGHRIEPFNVPWGLIGAGMLLAIGSAMGAAWWPARTVARIPVTLALSGRSPRPKPTHHSVGLAVALIMIGLICLVLADQTSYLLIITGTVTTVVGVLLMSPVAIQGVAVVAGVFPVSVRLALRDLARYQDRSGAALAAISLALGCASAIIIVVSAAKDNLSDSQLLIWTRNPDDPEGVSPFYTEDPNDSGFSPFIPVWTPAELESLEAQVDRIAALSDEPRVTALDVAVDPAIGPDPCCTGRQAITLAKHFSQGGDEGWQDITLLYIVTPELLELYGLDLEGLDPNLEILTVETDSLRFIGMARNPATGRFEPEIVQNSQQLERLYTSIPGSFITPEALRKRGWEPSRVGWLVQTDQPLTSEQLVEARKLAVEADVLIEVQYQNEGLLALRWQATAAGMFVSLAVLSMTVGLIRSESAGDLRILTATGATRRIRRSLTAATAGVLALFGAVMGIAGAYLGLIAGYSSDILTPNSLLYLSIFCVGVPLVAVMGGWLLAGREPPMLAHQPME